MKKITFILIALVISFTSCSDDDDDAPETCTEYVARYEKRQNDLDEDDFEGQLLILKEFVDNIPEGCEYLIEED